jgi:outer membrane protein assembly factor BamB
VSVRRGSAVWARRGILAVVLVGAAIIPGRAATVTASHCTKPGCTQHLRVATWTRPLAGSWVAQGGALGTVLAVGEAYATAGSGVAAVGFGDTILAYRLSSGTPLWTARLTGFGPGSAIASVRAWPGVLTIGVAGAPVAGQVAGRHEVVLSAATGQRVGVHPAAAYGGAIAASKARTVIVGTTAVTCYANATGRVIWRRPTGAVPQAWRVDGGAVFLTVARGGYLGSSPVTAVRRVSLRTGAQKMLRPASGAFAGQLSAAAGGAVLFSGSAGLTAYSQATGRLLWRRAGAVPQAVDAIAQRLYVVSGKALIGLDPQTGKVVSRSATPGAAGLYAVSDGVALGLDEGALGDAWGYDLRSKRVIWTARAVPWPHFFVDLSGIGGSVSASGGSVVLAACAQVGTAPSSGAAAPCDQPELVAITPQGSGA